MTVTLEQLADEIVETDILILGGGLAGCMAAIRAKEKNNLDVVVVEKAAIMRSGEAGHGVDHYPGLAHPKINAIDAEEYGRKRAGDLHPLVSTKLSVITAKNAFKPLALLEDIGVKIREEDGTFKVAPGRLKVLPRAIERQGLVKGDFVLIRAADLKLKLAAEVRKRGVRVFEHTMLTNLITKDGSVTGATAVNVRNGKFVVFKAKGVALTTGAMQSRIYSYPYATFPNNLFIGSSCPANLGSGAAAAYRAGARLINLEFVDVHVCALGWDFGPQGATMMGKMKNLAGEDLFEKYLRVTTQRGKGAFYPWGAYAFMPDMSKPEIDRNVISRHWDGVGEEAELYQHFSGANETPFVLKLMRDRGGLRKAPFELFPWLRGIPRGISGVMMDERGETSLKGLFVAGDIVGGLPGYAGPGAYVWGSRIADHLTEYVPDTKKPVLDGEQIMQVQAERDHVRAPLGRKDGVNPLELEDLVRKINTYYVGINKIEPRLKRALELIKVLKERFVPTLMARNPHELMRALEVQDILDLSEIHAQTALIRTETRMPPHHYRVDYPEQDDMHWQKSIVIRRVAGEMKPTLETLA
jgi:succinate dehydrogenase/fumarate reductase flavoprotein subunit